MESLSCRSEARSAVPAPKKSPPLARFATGLPVRVKNGTHDADVPGVALEGWSGTILDVNDQSNPPKYRIEWDRRTHDQMPADYRERCERAGFDLATLWLDEDKIEAVPGTLVPVAAPVTIVLHLSTDSADRIRKIFGLAEADPLPEWSRANQSRYRAYLTERLTFPFSATFEANGAQTRKISVLALLPADEADDELGLICEVWDGEKTTTLPLAAVLIRKRQGGQLLDDYRRWVWSQKFTRELHEADEPRVGVKTVLSTLFMSSLIGSLYAAILGSAWTALDGAMVAIRVARYSLPWSAPC